MNDELVYVCEICQTVLNEHHCKAQCPNCGRLFDCSDLPIMQANFRIDEKSNELIPGPGSDPRDTLPKGVEDSPVEKRKKLRNPNT